MEDVVVFGIGRIGKGAIPFLKKRFHILFLTDNNNCKWGSVFEGYTVKPVPEIMRYNCDIVITSTKYGYSIAEQLQHMGISADKIYFCRKFQMDDRWAYETYPMVEEKVEVTGIPLRRYDLYYRREQKTDCKKVMIFCSFFSVYAKQVIENIAERYDDVEFSLLTNALESKDNIDSYKLRHIYYYQSMADLKTILTQLPQYDVMQLLWIEREWAYYYKIIRQKAKRLNLNVGGSDFYRAVKEDRNFKRILISSADYVTAETEETVREFVEYYHDDIHGKMGLLPFGIETLKFIDENKGLSRSLIKEKFNIPPNKLIVTCGHNAGEAHRHMAIIEALSHMSIELKKQIICVFPMTYPKDREEYIGQIETRLATEDVDYVILKKFMNFQEMAEYALISDIMIHVQTTDQLSSTMLEEMYAGSIVIAGKWLPYEALHDLGIYFLDVHSIDEITPLLEDVISNIEEYKNRCKQNRLIVGKHSSWDEVAPRWHALWE